MAGTDEEAGLADFLVHAALFGPGLGMPVMESSIDGPSSMGPGHAYPSPSDQHKCSTFLSETETIEMDNNRSVKDYEERNGRCTMTIPYYKQTLIVNYKLSVTLPEAGDYYIVMQPINAAAGRFWVTVGTEEHTEDMTEWQIPYKGPTGKFTGAEYYDPFAKLSCCKKGKRTKGDWGDCKPLLQ
eukprot:gene568-1978_t